MQYSWTGYFWLNRQMSKYNFTAFYLDAQNLHVQLQSIYFFPNNEIFALLDKLDELDKTSGAWTRWNLKALCKQ